MHLERLFDFFGINFLTGRIDTVRPAPQQGHRPIGLHGAPVARNGIAHAIDRREGLRRLLRVLVIAERHRAAARHEARLAAARLDLAMVLAEHLAVRAKFELARFHFAIRRHRG